MPDSVLSVLDSSGTAQNIDTRTEGSNSHMRQVVVLGDPDANAAVGAVVSADPGPTSTAYGQVVRLAGSATIQAINGSVGVYFDRGNPSISVSNASIAVHLLSTAGTIQVKTDPSSTIAGVVSSIAVYFDRANPTVAVSSIVSSIGVYFDRGNPQVNLGVGSNLVGVVGLQSTASIFTVSGSASTVAYNTLVSPSANYNFKIFAYSIQTTGVASIAPRFTTGASAGATELWRPLITAASSSSAPVGANLAVSPPAYLFATGVNTTLNLYLDAATLVHYSVSYIKESA